jgi:hypothetical protein
MPPPLSRIATRSDLPRKGGGGDCRRGGSFKNRASGKAYRFRSDPQTAPFSTSASISPFE